MLVTATGLMRMKDDEADAAVIRPKILMKVNVDKATTPSTSVMMRETSMPLSSAS